MSAPTTLVRHAQGWICLSSVARELSVRLLPHTQKRSITLDLNVPRGLFIWGERDRLYTLLGGLLADLIRSFGPSRHLRRIHIDAYDTGRNLRLELLALGADLRALTPRHIARSGALLGDLYGADLGVLADGQQGANRLSIAFGHYLVRPLREKISGCQICMLPVSHERAWLYWQMPAGILSGHHPPAIRIWPGWQVIFHPNETEGSIPIPIIEQKQRAFLGLEGAERFIELARSNPIAPPPKESSHQSQQLWLQTSVDDALLRQGV